MNLWEQLLLGGAIPFGVTGALLLIFADRTSGRLADIKVAIAMAAGFLSGYVSLFGFPGLPPETGWEVPPYLAIFAPLAGAAVTKAGGFAGLLTGMILSGLAIFFVLEPLLPQAIPWLTAVLWSIAVGEFLVVQWWGLRPIGRRAPIAILESLAVTALGISAVLMLAGSARLAQMAGLLAAAFGAIVLFSWWRGKLVLSHASLAWSAILCGGLLANGYFYTEDVPLVSVFILLVAPLAAWADELDFVKGRRGWKRKVLRSIFAVFPAVVAVLFAWISRPPVTDYYY